jgi:SagB-type dehydrogenase family enzyme
MRINFGEVFHQKSKDRTMDGKVRIPQDASLWPPEWKEIAYKKYDRFPSIVLPTPVPKVFGNSDLAKRKSVHGFGIVDKNTGEKEYKKITLQELSNILYYSCGEVRKNQNREMSKRAQGSAGGRYPIEVYVLNFEKGELPTKCYHYDVEEHLLKELWDVTLSNKKDITKYFNESWALEASAAVILTGVPERVVMKYGERGYRYMYIEAGAILSNIQNNCIVNGLSSCVLGATDDVAIEELLDLDGKNETTILGMLLG